MDDLFIASSSGNWNLGRKNDIYCISAFWCQPNPWVLFTLEMAAIEKLMGQVASSYFGLGAWLLLKVLSSIRQNWMGFSSWVSLHTWIVLVEISVWVWPWGLSISVGLWLSDSLYFGLFFCFLIVSPTKWTKLPYIAMNFYSKRALIVSKNEMYSWILINIYDRFWVLIFMGFK